LVLDIGVTVIIAVALVLHLLAEVVSGALIPPVQKWLGIDPVLPGAVILTTLTDVIGFLSFLGLASVFLL